MQGGSFSDDGKPAEVLVADDTLPRLQGLRALMILLAKLMKIFFGRFNQVRQIEVEMPDKVASTPPEERRGY